MKLKLAGVGFVVVVAGTVAALALAGAITPITVAPKDSAGTVSIVGIDGGDTSASQTFDVLSFSVGVDNPSSVIGGGGGGAGKANLHDLTITKLIDKASPNLFLACATGRHIQRVTLVLNRPNAPSGTAFMTYRLDDVVVTSDTHSGTGNDRPVERVTFQYNRIDQTYVTSDGETVETSFDNSGF
jgi:type VI secretion system secreted protein Hcp